MPQGLELSQKNLWGLLTSEFSNFSSGPIWANYCQVMDLSVWLSGNSSLHVQKRRMLWTEFPNEDIATYSPCGYLKDEATASSKGASSFFLLFYLETAFSAGKSIFPRDRKQSNITGNFENFLFVVSNLNSFIPIGEPLITSDYSFILWNVEDSEIPNLHSCQGSIFSLCQVLWTTTLCIYQCFYKWAGFLFPSPF